jgi:hypothetical protein
MSKTTKRRDCPALQKEITAADCGENRNSRYNCPAHCGFNPLAPAQYSQLLELERSVDLRLLEWERKEAADPNEFEKGFQKALNSPSGHAVHAYCAWHLMNKPGPDGLTCIQRWERAGFPGLKNDERVIARSKINTRIVLLEVHRVLNDEQVECVDLLERDGAPFIIQDRALAAVAVRFATAVTWSFPLPHFHRLVGTAIVLPELMGEFEPPQIVAAIVRHLGGPVDETGMRHWLAEHYLRFDDALGATVTSRRRQMFANIDAQFGKAIYELRTPFAALREKLDDLDEVHQDDLSSAERNEGFAEARVWFAREDEGLPAMPDSAQAVLGRILLGQSHWRLEAIGKERLATLRERFEALAGDKIKFAGERRDNLATDLLSRLPEADLSLVPPVLLEQPNKVLFGSSRLPVQPEGGENLSPQALRAAIDRAFLDDRVPALDNHTPREAAADPSLRPKLIRLLKNRVRAHDEENLRTGRTDDINWMLRELGVTEILFDPPPPRPATDPSVEDEEDEFDEFDEEDADLPLSEDMPEPPPLPDAPLSDLETSERLNEVLDYYDDADEVLRAFRATNPILFNDLLELVGNDFNPDERALLFSHLALACFALTTSGTRIPFVEFDELERVYSEQTRLMMSDLKPGKADGMIRYLEKAVQPRLVSAVVYLLLNAEKAAPRNIPLRPEATSLMLPIIKTVVQVVDRALR